MSPSTFSPGQRIEHAAAEWWSRLRDPAVPDQAIAQWAAWLEADPRHAAAFDRASALAEAAAALKGDQRADLLARFAPPASTPRRGPARATLALAAGLAAVVVLGGGLFLAYRHGPDAPRAYASERAGHRDIDLPDGSSIELGGATSVTARYGRDIRAVDLDAGEAFFRVAHAERPFVVTAGPLRIRDLGTAFNVRRTGDRVTVAVTEGRVRVSPSADEGDGGTVELGAGREVSFDPETRAMRILDIDPVTATAWRDHRLEFVNEPLSSVLENINRYSARPIRVADPALSRLTFTGTVQVDTIDSWVAALPRVFPVRVDTYADHLELTRQTSMARSPKPR
ncbi:FecR family protein [Luteibacter aegosomatissinici]|uniref:FecR family protein n=1 Tax=Luteibacter aegosomatissinici TaxID=2911539 RepID=UPI001FFAED2E|nr:FecR domain-containing protein [Luteibacter aegosomatissinici]UPG94717.1 FecR domain-containing protein [Luteibacter aegosomatissinici]